jgi:hypothetical protein
MSMNKTNGNLVKTNVEQLTKGPQTRRRYLVFEQVPTGTCLVDKVEVK